MPFLHLQSDPDKGGNFPAAGMRQSRGGAKITPHIVNEDVELHSNHFTYKLVHLNYFFDGPIAYASLPGFDCTSRMLAVMLHSILKVMNQWDYFRPSNGLGFI